MFIEEINKLWLKLIIIGVAICVIPPFIYAAVVYFIQQSPSYRVIIDYPILKILNYCLLGVSVIIIMPLLYFLKGRFINVNFRYPPVNTTPQMEKTFNSIVPPIIMMAYIVICAICESVAIFGLVYGILGGNVYHVLVYQAISLAFFIRFSLKKGEVEHMALILAEKYDLIED